MGRFVTALVVLLAPMAAVACGAADGDQAKKEAPAVSMDAVEFSRQPIAPPTQWRCQDGQSFIASFFGAPDRVEMAFDDGAQIMLPKAVAGSGLLYESASQSFQAKGNEAKWLRAGREPTLCAVVR